MGKTTTAQMFASHGVPVWDADHAVHRLYQKGGAAVGPVSAIAPGAIVEDAISRDKLRAIIGRDPGMISKLEAIVHPLLARDREAFIEANHNEAVLLFDIPLLFETGADTWLDKTICVTVPSDIQKERVMGRGTMSEAEFETLKSRQMPDAEKQAKADYVLSTRALNETEAAVLSLLETLRGMHA